MSVYKVISNTFMELVDYVESKYRKYGNNYDTLMNQLRDDEKRDLIIKLAFVIQKMETTSTAQWNFYKAKEKNAEIFKTLIIIIIVVTGLIMCWICSWQMSEQYKSKKDKHPPAYIAIALARTFIMYCIIFIIVFAVFFMIYVNSDRNQKQVRYLKNEFKNMILGTTNSFLSLLPLGEECVRVLKYVAYKNTETRSKYEALSNDIGTTVMTEIFDSATKLIKYGGIYTRYKTNFKTCFIALLGEQCNKGMANVRRMLVRSSNTMMIKEMRVILKYYYKLIKSNVDEEQAELSKRNILNSLVVAELSNISLVNNLLSPSFSSYLSAPVNVQLDKIVDKYVTMSPFEVKYLRLKCLFTFMAIYCYQLWVAKKADHADFEDELRKYMPHLLSEAFMKSVNDAEFLNTLKTKFTEHYNGSLTSLITNSTVNCVATTVPSTNMYYKVVNGNTYVNSVENVGNTYTLVKVLQQSCDPNFNTACKAVFTAFEDVFKKVYVDVITHIEDGYWFPLDINFLALNIDNFISTLVSLQDTGFPRGQRCAKTDAYLSNFLFAFKDSIHPGLITYLQSYGTQFTTDVVAKISPKLLSLNIKLQDNSAYIMSALGDGVKPEDKPKVLELLQMIDHDVSQKQSAYGIKKQDNRFKTSTEFVTDIDAIQYNDLQIGLNSLYFKGVIDEFHKDISSAINSTENSRDSEFFSSKNIFLNQKKNDYLISVGFKIFTTVVVLMCVYHVLYFVKVLGKEWNKYDIDVSNTAQGMANLDAKDKQNIRKYLPLIKADNKITLIFQIVVPVLVAGFVSTMLWSTLKKRDARNIFNRETIDSNTASLKASVNELNTLFIELDAKVGNAKEMFLGGLKQITFDDKIAIYNRVKNIVDKYEKCNYILAAQSGTIPFPYTEVTLDAFMIVLCILCAVYLIGKVNPIERIRDIKTLFKLQERGEYSEFDESYKKEVTTKAACHDNDIDSIVFTLKVLFFIFIVMFLVFYSSKIISSTTEYESGIYNSVFYEENLCLD